MSESRKIIHLDLDAFYCAVEEQLNPALNGKAFAVGGSPDSRGVVASCSYAARSFGVRSAMPMSRAVQLCPALQIVPWRRNEYGKKSKQVMAVLHQVTDLVEQLSIDEAFLDVSQRAADIRTIARELQEQIKQETGLPASLGAATNKLVAKVATDVGKAAIKTNTYPSAIQIVNPGQEAAFLAPLPSEALWGIGPKTAEQLAKIGVRTIGDLANWPERDLYQRFGQQGYDLARRANGIDYREVITQRATKSISQETTFEQDVSDETQLLSKLRKQADSIGKSLKHADLLGATVKLKLRWADFTTVTRQTTLPDPTDQADMIYQYAVELFQQNWKRGLPIRLIGLGISGLQPPSRQLSLWDSPNLQKQANLQTVIDELREKFGQESIYQGITTDPEEND